MADTLTQLIAKAQAQLQDNGTLFTTATLTAAARHALNDLNRAAPLHVALTVTAVADQHVYELEDLTALQITDVLLDGDNEFDVGLAYDAFVEDARWWFRLRTAQTQGDQLIVQYTKPHTISGLDGSLDSTLADDLNTAVLDGMCYYACLSRAAAGIEANNVQPAVSAGWLKLAQTWFDIFNRALAMARLQPTAKGEPGQALAWNDPQHSTEYP